MFAFLGGISIGIEEGVKYIPFAIAACLLFRVAHFPDIGIEGSFALGSASLVFAAQLGIDGFYSLVLSVLLGSVGGGMTAVLFIYYKLNSLLCGLITSLVSYSLTFFLLGRHSSCYVDPFIDEIGIALIGLCLAVLLIVFFSTKYGLVLRVVGEQPKLIRKLGYSPTKYMFILLVLGNAIAGLSGALVVAAEGVATLSIGKSKLVLALIALILGEGLLSFVSVFSWILFRKMKCEALSLFFKKYFDGGGVRYLIISAMVGIVFYWTIYNASTNVFGADEYSDAILGFGVAFFLVMMKKMIKNDSSKNKWSFIGNFHGG